MDWSMPADRDHSHPNSWKSDRWSPHRRSLRSQQSIGIDSLPPVRSNLDRSSMHVWADEQQNLQCSDRRHFSARIPLIWRHRASCCSNERSLRWSMMPFVSFDGLLKCQHLSNQWHDGRMLCSANEMDDDRCFCSQPHAFDRAVRICFAHRWISSRVWNDYLDLLLFFIDSLLATARERSVRIATKLCNWCRGKSFSSHWSATRSERQTEQINDQDSLFLAIVVDGLVHVNIICHLFSSCGNINCLLKLINVDTCFLPIWDSSFHSKTNTVCMHYILSQRERDASPAVCRPFSVPFVWCS